MSHHPFELTTVIYTDPETIEDVRRLRAALPPSGVPVMDAHVTVYGRVFDLDPQVALERLRHVCRLHPSMTLRAQGLEAWFGGPGPTRTINSSRVALRHEPIEGGDVPGVSLGLPVTCPAALRDLHLAVYSVLADDEMGGAFGAPATYRPHLTLTQDMARDRLAEAVATIGDVPSWTFEAHEVALMRREAEGFVLVGTAPLLGARDAASEARRP